MTNARLLVVTAMVLVGAAARLVPHPPNVTPVAALALFAGACVPDRRLAVLVPVGAMALSDLALPGYPLAPAVYAAMLPSVGLGLLLRGRRTVGRVAAASLAGSVSFFAVTNFAVWAAGSWYPRTAAGLAECFAAALPFFRNTAAGDLAFAGALFGGLAWAERAWPALAASGPAAAEG